MSYVGRFAPSPTGALHLGTLAAAVTSFLHARQARGRWLVRIEDIDPPREIPGATDSILRTLEALDLHWDGPVRFQSKQIDSYLAAAEALLHRGSAFRCRCSRQQLRALSGTLRYPGTCRDLRLPKGDTAIRYRVDEGEVRFIDGLQGPQARDVARLDGDFVIVRRDGLPAYHLAVVLDDADQGVTDVVRGSDLLECTPLHILLYRAFGLPTPRYWHIPLVTNRQGEKLSKSAGAAAVSSDDAATSASRVLGLLGLTMPADLAYAPPRELWDFALTRLDFGLLRQRPGPVAIDD